MRPRPFLNASDASTDDCRATRRGVTLLEMLVVVALVVLMMVILASIFQAATGSITTSRVIQELDQNLRSLDITLRQDLAGATARFTPPLRPSDNLGYFEYGENAPADLQGEDIDDYIAFTAKAPEGQPFTGRVWVGLAPNGRNAAQPVTVTSQYAEIIYFLRNGNLYRRVLLVAPERKPSLLSAQPGTGTVGLFAPAMFANGSIVSSWMSVNDISATPPYGSGIANTFFANPIPNTLGKLTNRENRFARPRFGNDFYNISPYGTSGAGVQDGLPDDGNNDGIDDYYPTLTPLQVITAAGATPGNFVAGLLINEDSASRPGGSGIPSGYPRYNGTGSRLYDIYAFPFIYPGMYSKPEISSVGNALGWLHATDPTTTGGIGANQNPLEFGDSLPSNSTNSSFFGFPTWRETASSSWRDPSTSVMTLDGFAYTKPVGRQPYGLSPLDPTATPSPNDLNFPPPLGSLPPNGALPPDHPILNTYTNYSIPFASDNAGNLSASAFVSPAPVSAATTVANPYLWSAVWEDDLILSGVRSFDVKAFDSYPQAYNFTSAGGSVFYNAGYFDLGYASTDYIRNGIGTGMMAGTPSFIFDGNGNPTGFGHEGRMPPNTADNRVDPQRPLIRNPANNLLNLSNNVGDDRSGVIRLRRVWDSWSTDYTAAPSVDLNLRGAIQQLSPLDRPIYPSYPAPYTTPLRGIRIQIRVVDPKNERVKILTINQDFSDKL